jgi:hypothetical protein
MTIGVSKHFGMLPNRRSDVSAPLQRAIRLAVLTTYPAVVLRHGRLRRATQGFRFGYGCQTKTCMPMSVGMTGRSFAAAASALVLFRAHVRISVGITGRRRIRRRLRRLGWLRGFGGL